MQIGRIELLTDEPVITYDNIIPILRKVMPKHVQNATQIEYLDAYEKGYQPLCRTKTYRKDINIETVDNVANEITEFKTSYQWGTPITIVIKGENAETDGTITEAVSLLNACYEAEEIRKKTQHLARNVEVGCRGYTYVDVNMDEMDVKNGDSYFKVESLDPTCTFVVRSSFYFDKRPMIGVTFRYASNGQRHITAFTKDQRFELIGYKHTDRSGEENPLRMIPIIEWIRSYDGMGCFERQIPEMDALNVLESDICNATDESVQAIWHCNDVDFPTEVTENGDGTKTEVVRKPKNNDWLQTYTSTEGKTPFVTPLSSNFDYEGNLNYVISKRALILQKCNVPTRNDNSGGSTGIAMDSATGWSAAEVEAQRQQNIMESCKMEEIKVVLRAIQESPYVPQNSPLLKLKYTDVAPSVKRSKSFELTTKVNFFATAVSHGIHGLHALKVMNLFEDVAQVYADSKELIQRYQDSVFDKQTENFTQSGNGERDPNSERMDQDYSDQIDNSPSVDGMETK